MFLLYLVLLIVPIILWGILFVKKRHRYWKDRGVSYLEPSFPKGNLGRSKKTEHFFELTKRLYFDLKTKERNGKPLGGIFVTIRPAAMVLDLDFVKTMFMKDFQYFNDRGFYFNERDDPINANLLTMKGEPWKILRNKLSPTFTSSKIKLMMPTMVDISKQLINRLNEDLKNENILELSDYFSRFTIDIIGSSAFGIECNSLKNSDTEFLRMGKKVFTTSKSRFLKVLFLSVFPEIAYKLHMKETLNDVDEFYTGLITEIVAYRERNNIQRNDFLNLLIQLKKKGELDDSFGKNSEGLTLKEVISNTYIFLLAGYETSALTLQYCFLELAHNHEIQNRLRQDIKSAFDQCNEEITYEAIMELKYMDQVLNETLRRHTPVGFLVRYVSDDYRVENTDLVLEKGTAVIISTLGIHHDPDIYPDPEKFDPERFSPEAISSRHPCTFFGFGEGPRNCIGSRFAMLEMKIAITYLLMNYKFSLCDKTRYPIEYSNTRIIMAPAGGCWLKIEKLLKE